MKAFLADARPVKKSTTLRGGSHHAHANGTLIDRRPASAPSGIGTAGAVARGKGSLASVGEKGDSLGGGGLIVSESRRPGTASAALGLGGSAREIRGDNHLVRV